MIDFEEGYDAFKDQTDMFHKPGMFDRFMDFIESPMLGHATKMWARGLTVALVFTALTFTARFFMQYANPFGEGDGVN